MLCRTIHMILPRPVRIEIKRLKGSKTAIQSCLSSLFYWCTFFDRTFHSSLTWRLFNKCENKLIKLKFFISASTLASAPVLIDRNGYL